MLWKIVKGMFFYLYHISVFTFFIVMAALRTNKKDFSPTILGLHNLSLILTAIALGIVIFGGFYYEIRRLFQIVKDRFIEIVNRIRNVCEDATAKVKEGLKRLFEYFQKMEDWIFDLFYYKDIKENRKIQQWDKNLFLKKESSSPFLEKKEIHPVKLVGIALAAIFEWLLLYWVFNEVWHQVATKTHGMSVVFEYIFAILAATVYEIIIVAAGSLGLAAWKEVLYFDSVNQKVVRAQLYGKVIVFSLVFLIGIGIELSLVMGRITTFRNSPNISDVTKELIYYSEPAFFMIALGTIMLLAYYGEAVWEWKQISLRPQRASIGGVFSRLLYVILSLIIYLPVKIVTFLLKIIVLILTYVIMFFLTLFGWSLQPVIWIVNFVVLIMTIITQIAYALIFPFIYLWPINCLPVARDLEKWFYKF